MGPMCRALVVCLTPARVSVSKLGMPFDEGVDRASRHVITSRQIERPGDGGRRLVKHMRSARRAQGMATPEARAAGMGACASSPRGGAQPRLPSLGENRAEGQREAAAGHEAAGATPACQSAIRLGARIERWVDGWAREIASVHEIYSGARQRLTAAPLAVYDTLGMVPLPAIARRPRAARPPRPSCRAPRQRIAGAGAPTTALIRCSRRSQRRVAR